MGALSGKVAWVTGAGSGIGEATALALAEAGAKVALTGRRPDPLEAVAARIRSGGGDALVVPGSAADAASVAKIGTRIADWQGGRLDILVNNAGSNVRARRWHELTPEAIDTVLGANLSAAFYCSAAALRLMRPRREGIVIHISSWAGRFLGNVAGAGYSAAKSGLIAMSHTINMEEHGHGIRSTVIMPAEVATPILDSRPEPPPASERARMLQPRDLADLVLFVATRPPGVCLNEVLISPTANRMI